MANTDRKDVLIQNLICYFAENYDYVGSLREQIKEYVGMTDEELDYYEVFDDEDEWDDDEDEWDGE